MAYTMKKHGNLDNQVANEFMCDTTADLQNIAPEDITFGSVALIIDTTEIFIANSQKEWKSMTPSTEEEEEEG